MNGRETSNEPPDRVLTQAEVDALPDGAMIEVTWSGGNGPHVYVTERHGRYVAALVPGGPMKGYQAGVLMFCGEKPRTEVRRV